MISISISIPLFHPCSLLRLSRQSRNSIFSEILKPITNTAGGYFYIALHCSSCGYELHLHLLTCSYRSALPCSSLSHVAFHSPTMSKVVFNELIIKRSTATQIIFFKSTLLEKCFYSIFCLFILFL